MTGLFCTWDIGMGLRIVLDPVGDNAVGEAKMTSETEGFFDEPTQWQGVGWDVLTRYG